MMTITSVTLLLCSIMVLCSAKLCTPDQWEGREGGVGGYSGHSRERGVVMEDSVVAYDFTNKRTASFISYTNNEYRNKFRVVKKYDGDVGMVYVLDLKKDKCWKKKLEKPFRQACVPDEAKSYGDFTLGVGNTITASSYYMSIGKLSFSISVQKLSDTQCIPLSELVLGEMGKYSFLNINGFMDISPGIKNETIFDVPKECEERQDFSLAQELMRDHYILTI